MPTQMVSDADAEALILSRTRLRVGPQSGGGRVQEAGGPMTMTDRERIDHALDLVTRYGGTDGAHHLRWVLDQIVRTLAGDGYAEWVRAFNDGEDGPDTYGWDEGIAP